MLKYRERITTEYEMRTPTGEIAVEVITPTAFRFTYRRSKPYAGTVMTIRNFDSYQDACAFAPEVISAELSAMQAEMKQVIES